MRLKNIPHCKKVESIKKIKIIPPSSVAKKKKYKQILIMWNELIHKLILKTE